MADFHLQPGRRCRAPLLRLAATSLLLAACACGGEPQASSNELHERILPVIAAKAGTADLRETIEAVGTLYAAARAEIRPQVDGIISAFGFKEGETVESGRELVSLDDSKAAASRSLAKAKLDSAEARLDVARDRLERSKRLIADELVSRQEFENLEADFLTAQAAVRENKAAVRLAERELEDFHLRAPFDGTVGAQLIDIGNYVERGTKITEILRTDPVEVHFAVSARLSDGVKVGQELRISRPGAQQPITGKLRFVNPSVDAETRMLELQGLIPNAQGLLRPGQFVQVSLLRELKRDRVVVPEEAVVPYAGKSWVFVVEDGVAQRREVGLGARQPGMVEVSSGLRAGETIVVSGQHRLSDGSKVKVLDRQPGLERSGQGPDR